MAIEPPTLDLPFDELPQFGEPWVKTFELANNFSGLSATYGLDWDAATIEEAMNALELPTKKLKPLSPAEVLSTTNDLVKRVIQTNPGLRITGWDMGNVDAGRTFMRHVIGGCNPAAVDYATQRVQNLADPEREHLQKELDVQQARRLVYLAARFEAAGRLFTPPSQLWTISVEDMTSIERQATSMFPSARPVPRPFRPGQS